MDVDDLLRLIHQENLRKEKKMNLSVIPTKENPSDSELAKQSLILKTLDSSTTLRFAQNDTFWTPSFI